MYYKKYKTSCKKLKWTLYTGINKTTSFEAYYMYGFKGDYFIISTRVHYSPEIKWKAIDMKLNGSTKKEVMNKLGIKNKFQIMA